MRILTILCIIAAALASTTTANAQGKGSKGDKASKGQDMGAIRDKCQAEAVGYGINRSAQIRACMERARGAKR
jgi:hypothetical protein